MIKTTPMDPDWKARLDKAFYLYAQRDPRWRELRERLLALGGEHLVACDEPDMALLIASGREFPARSAYLVPGKPRNCHDNALRLHAREPRRIKVATGYGLSPDGVWRSHSWGWESDQRVVETTVRRIAYYGAVVMVEDRR